MVNQTIEQKTKSGILTRTILAGKKDPDGKSWVFVETIKNNSEKSRQWIDLKFFKSWLGI